MGPGINSNLQVLLDWRCDIPALYPEQNRSVHLQMWWIRWGTRMYSNIPFWRNVSGYFLAKYIYEIDCILTKRRTPPLQRLIGIIADIDDTHYIEKYGYEAFLLKGGLKNYFAHQPDFFYLCKKRLFDYYREKDLCDMLESVYGTCEPESPRFLIKDNRLVDLVVIGNQRDEVGLGVDKVTYAKALSSLGLVVHVQSNDDPIERIAPLNVMVLPLPSVYVQRMKDVYDLMDSAVNIIVAPWELPKLPNALVPYAEWADWIFYSSDFVRKGYPPSVSGKLLYMPPIVEIPEHTTPISIDSLDESTFNILVVFDLSSYQSRKNPFAAITAYIHAFDEGRKETRLYVKVNSSQYESEQLAVLMQYINQLHRDDITVIDATFSREELFYFYSRMDVLLHLHRSEGFGRNIAEFMKLGKAVICTGFSGNMDYCNTSNSLLVGYDTVAVGADEYLFAEGQCWAEPHVDEASNHLKTLFLHREKIMEYGLSAKKKIDNLYTLENATLHFKNGLMEALS